VEVVVDLATATVAPDGWNTVTSLAVQVDGGTGSPDEAAEARLATMLAGAGVSRSAAHRDVCVAPSVLRDLAARAATVAGHTLDAAWDEGFAGMVADAGTKGWIDDDGAIRAHVEWRNA
jgi:hypothetical protein